MNQVKVLAAVRSARYCLGRWLLRPEATRVIGHYSRVLAETEDQERAQRLRYLLIGAKYIANGWHE